APATSAPSAPMRPTAPASSSPSPPRRSSPAPPRSATTAPNCTSSWPATTDRTPRAPPLDRARTGGGQSLTPSGEAVVAARLPSPYGEHVAGRDEEALV